MHWKEVLAIDSYEITSNGVLHPKDWHVLTLLYQPLMGSGAYSLYMTMWGELELEGDPTKSRPHHHILTNMQCSLPEMVGYRRNLEALGLLKSFNKTVNEDLRTFIYELVPPLDAKRFFQDGVLNVLLYERLGKRGYQERMALFTKQTVNKEEYKEISVPFNSVFSPSNSSFAAVEDMDVILQREMIGRGTPEGIEVFNNFFDYELFLQGLSNSMVSRESITKPVKEMILRLAYIYELDIFEMQKVILDSLDANDCVVLESLRKNAQQAYQYTTGSKIPTVYAKAQKNESPKAKKGSEKKTPETKEERLIEALEQVSPLEFLTQFGNGARPSSGDLQIVESVMNEQKLSAPVVNVLLYYVLLITDKKLSKGYVTKIAAHWARKGVKTAAEAMALAKSEQQQYEEWANKKTTAKPKTTAKGRVRKEVIPDWMKPEDELPKEIPNALNQNFEEERDKLDDRLQKYIAKHYATKGD